MTSAIGGDTLAPLESDERRRDRWCAIALAAAALLEVASQLPGLFDSSRVHVIPYSWVIALAEAVVLVVVARAFLDGRHRLFASAFLVGFCATALSTVLFGLTYWLDRSSGVFVTRRFWLGFAAAGLVVVVAARGVRVILAEPRARAAVPLVVSAIVAVTVFITIKTVWRPVIGPSWLSQTLDLVLFVVVAAVPVFAARRAGFGALMICGLAAALTLTLAGELIARFFLHPAPNNIGDDALLAICIALLVALAASVHLRSAREAVHS